MDSFYANDNNKITKDENPNTFLITKEGDITRITTKQIFGKRYSVTLPGVCILAKEKYTYDIDSNIYHKFLWTLYITMEHESNYKHYKFIRNGHYDHDDDDYCNVPLLDEDMKHFSH